MVLCDDAVVLDDLTWKEESREVYIKTKPSLELDLKHSRVRVSMKFKYQVYAIFRIASALL